MELFSDLLRSNRASDVDSASEADEGGAAAAHGVFGWGDVGDDGLSPESAEESDGDSGSEGISSGDDDLAALDTVALPALLDDDGAGVDSEAAFMRFMANFSKSLATSSGAPELAAKPRARHRHIAPPPSSLGVDVIAPEKPSRGRPIGSRTRRAPLPRHINDLLGDANAAYATGNIKQAESLLKDILHQHSACYEAWLTLAMIAQDHYGDHRRAMLMKFCAAGHAWNADLWVELAEDEMARGNPHAAIYCYSKAIVIDKRNVALIKARRELYRELGLVDRVFQGNIQLLRLEPDDPDAVRELATWYIDQGQRVRAIHLYTRLLERTLPPEGPKHASSQPAPFSWNEVNMLTELHMDEGQWSAAVAVVKIGARRLQGRGREGEWDTFPRDDEYTDGRNDLLLDLRVKLGICRLMMDEFELAHSHFAYLLREPVSQYIDLYHSLGEAYISRELYREAIEVYVGIAGHLPDDLHSRLQLSECYRHLGDYDMARTTLHAVYAVAPTNVVIMERLGKLYEDMGEDMRSVQFYGEADRMKRVAAEAVTEESGPRPMKAKVDQDSGEGFDYEELSDSDSEYRPGSADEHEQSSAGDDEDFEPDAAAATRRRGGKRTTVVSEWDTRRALARSGISSKASKAMLEELERERNLSVANAMRRFDVIDREWPNIGANVGHYVAAMKVLVEDFRSVTKYFLAGSACGPKAVARSKAGATLASDGYRGRQTEFWHLLCIKYGFGLAMIGDASEACRVLTDSQRCLAWSDNVQICSTFLMALCAIGLRFGNTNHVLTVSRNLMTRSLSLAAPCRLYWLLSGCDAQDVDAFSNPSAGKYFVRWVKEAGFHPGTAQLDGAPKVNSLMAVIVGQMGLVSKNYIQACRFLTLSLAHFPDDPTILLCLAVTWLHRGMQRTTENRHRSVLNAMSFLGRYARCRGGRGAAEVEYNYGRAFHMLGLSSQACDRYEAVLGLGDGDPLLTRHAAYNLHHLYMQSGSPVLAKMVLQQHLSL